MKILQVTNFFKPSWETGGVTKVSYDLSKNLVTTGHDVTVYTTDGYNSRLDVPKNQLVEIDGIKVYYFSNLFSYFVKKLTLPTPYYLPFVLRKEIKNFDIIHIHEHRTLSAAIVHYYAKKHGVPYVLQSHGSVLSFLQKQNFKKAFDFFVGNSILKNATKVIALNEDEASQYQQMGVHKNNINIIPNGINLDEYKNVPPKGTFKANYKISENEKIVLYVGRVHKSKGIDLLIRAIPLLLEKNPNIRLVIVGPDGGFQHELEELTRKFNIENNVIFTGFVDKDVKIAALVDADVFVTPNFSGFPMTFLEAGVFGLPIITTNKGDSLDWIHNKAGLVISYKYEDLDNAIFSVLSDSGLRNKFSTGVKDIVDSRFSMRNYVQRIETLYNECAGNKNYTL